MELRIGGSVIDLDPKTRVKAFYNNTMFLDDFLDGDRTDPFFIPPTDRNRKFFRHLEKPESVNVPVKFDNTELREQEGGKIVISGTLYIQHAADEGYSGYILSGMGVLSPLRDVLLKDVDLGGVRSINGSAQEITFTVNIITHATKLVFRLWDSYIITLSASIFSNAPLNYIKNEINAKTFFYNGDPYTVTATSGTNWLKIVANWAGVSPPMIAFLYGQTPNSANITAVTEQSGAAAVVTAWQDLMELVTDTEADSDYLFFPVLFKEPGIKDFSVLPTVIYEEFYANYFTAGAFDMSYKPGVGAGGDTARTAPLPFIKMLYVLQQIVGDKGFKLSGNFTTLADIKNCVLFNNNFLLEPYLAIPFELSPYKTIIDLANHVPPAKTVNDFLLAIRKLFAISFYPNSFNRTFEILTLNEMLDSTDAVNYSGICFPKKISNFETEYKGFKFQFEFDGTDSLMDEKVQTLEGKNVLPPVTTFADLAVVDHARDNIVLVNDENAYYYAEYSEGGSFVQWSYYSDNLNELPVDDAEEEINSGSDTLVMEALDDSYSSAGEWKVPVTKTTPNTPAFWKEGYPDAVNPISDVGLRFLFYRGRFPQEDMDNYPLATHDDLKYDGSQISDVIYNMQWDGEKGLYQSAWKKFVAWKREAREVEMRWKLDALSINQLDMRKKAFVHGVHYFIKNIEIEYPITEPARVVAVKVGGLAPDPFDPGTLPSGPLRLLFDDIDNTPVADPNRVAQWNTLFNLPALGGRFKSVVVDGNEVKLYGGLGITLKTNLFLLNAHLISVIDEGAAVEVIGTSSFSSCSSLQIIELPYAITVGDLGCSTCVSLTTVNLISATTFNFCCFAGCTALTTVAATSAVSFGGSAFSECTALVSFICNSATSIGDGCFAECSSLATVVLNSAVNFLGLVFYNCTALTTLTIPVCTSLGTTSGDDSVFANIAGNTITLTIAAATAGDGDVTYLQANNTVTLVTV